MPEEAVQPRVVLPKMDAWRRRFARRVLGLTFVLEFPSALLLHAVLALNTTLAPFASALTALVALVINLPLFHRLTHWTDHDRASWLRIWCFDTPFFVHFMTCLFFGPIAWLVLLALGVGHAFRWIHDGVTVATTLGPIFLCALTVSAYSVFVRRFWTPVRTIEIPVRNLPDALDGYRLVQLSDIHCGPYLPRAFYRRLARRASNLGADAIVVTGDMITNGTGYLEDVTDFISQLSARAGVFASLGNHDYFGASEGAVEVAMESGGAKVLQNEGLVLDQARGGGLFLAATDDSWTHRDDLEKAMSQRPAQGPCVLLAHEPDTFPTIAQRDDVDLVLSGHTHAGQFAVPFFSQWNLARVRHRYTAGLYHLGQTALYVHAGNGTSGPPSRIGAAPEIALFVLRRA